MVVYTIIIILIIIWWWDDCGGHKVYLTLQRSCELNEHAFGWIITVNLSRFVWAFNLLFWVKTNFSETGTFYIVFSFVIISSPSLSLSHPLGLKLHGQTIGCLATKHSNIHRRAPYFYTSYSQKEVICPPIRSHTHTHTLCFHVSWGLFIELMIFIMYFT